MFLVLQYGKLYQSKLGKDYKMLLDTVKKIGLFPFTFAILKSLRSKIESNMGYSGNARIGSAFKKGYKGVLVVSSAGVGKTTVLKKIFNGLELYMKNDSGKTIGCWVPSGISTTVGLYQLLEQNNDSVIVIDELDTSSKGHIDVLKQISSGEICRLKNQNTKPIPFSGILLGACNGVSVSKKNFQHIIAMLERFTLVHIEQFENKEENIFNAKQEEFNELLSLHDWQEIAENLGSERNYNLNEEERELGKKLFLNKKKESLDLSKALWRQASEIKDIILFTKRFFDCKNIMENEALKNIVEQMVNDLVHCNPIKLLELSPIENNVIKFLNDNNGSADLDSIINFASSNGFFMTRRKFINLLNKMVEIRVLNKYSNDIYSTKNVNEAKNIEGILTKVL